MSSAKIRKSAERACTMSNWDEATAFLHRELEEKYWGMAEANLAIYLPSALADLESKEARQVWVEGIPEEYQSAVIHFTRHIWRSRKTSQKVKLQNTLF
tara:strand:+ start:72 stop:368 length:297 start_codon:yes stop_codon:yes gene_type:complete